MEESTFYQAILRKGLARGEAEGRAKGRLAEARAILVRVASRRFGAPSSTVLEQIDAIAEVDQIEQLIENTLSAASWDDLLHAIPGSAR
jgi:predicted transposase YdaD